MTELEELTKSLYDLRDETGFELVKDYIDTLLVVIETDSLTDSEKVELLEDAKDYQRFSLQVEHMKDQQRYKEMIGHFDTALGVVQGVIKLLLNNIL